MNKFKICFGIFIALAISRFVPHPPNFTSLISLSFYVPVIFGSRYLVVLLISFAITDLIIGFHSSVFFTWGSVLIIGLNAKYFTTTIILRIIGALSGTIVFYLVTNFGVWFGGMYSQNFEGLIESYIMGLPFFGYSLISTFLFSAVIESVMKFKKSRVGYFG